MDVFIRIVCSGNTAPLTPENWQEVLSDYLELSASKQAKRQLKFQCEIEYINNEIYLTRLLCASFAENYHNGFAERLRKRGYRYPFTPESYLKDIETVLIQLKSKETRVKQLTQEQADNQGKNTEPKEQDFLIQLADIAEWLKVPVIHAHELTVAEYCAKLVRFTEYCEHMAKLNNKNGSR